MTDEQTNKSDTQGEEVNPTPEKVDDTISPLDRAEAANKEKAKLLEEEKKLMDRKEKLHAEQMVGGKAKAGQLEETKEATAEELAEKFEKGDLDILA